MHFSLSLQTFKRILHINKKGSQLLLLNSTSISSIQWLDSFPKVPPPPSSPGDRWMDLPSPQVPTKHTEGPKVDDMAKIGKCQELRNPSKWSCCPKRHILGYHNSWTINKETNRKIHMKRSCFMVSDIILEARRSKPAETVEVSVLISSLPSKFNVWKTKGRHQLCAE